MCTRSRSIRLIHYIRNRNELKLRDYDSVGIQLSYDLLRVRCYCVINYYKYNITTNKKFAMHNWLRTGRLLPKTTSNNIDETVASSSTIESQ